MRVKKTACLLAVLAATSTAAMAESVDVKVVGTITPSACKPVLSGGGIVDYGVITPTSLKADALNQLEKKQLDFAITCDAPTKVGLRTIYGRPNTTAGTVETTGAGRAPSNISTDYGPFVVGLGLDGTKKIGGYNLAITDVTLDGAKAAYLHKFDGDTEWSASKDGGMQASTPFIKSYALPGSIAPASFTNLAGKLGVQAYINKASELDLTKPVKLDGLTTLELVYL